MLRTNPISYQALTRGTEACIRDFLFEAAGTTILLREQMYKDFANGAFLLWMRLVQDTLPPDDIASATAFEIDQARINALFENESNSTDHRS